MNPLLTSASSLIPLEREYEGWIMREIEDYFATIGRKAYIRAISPNTEESRWPADELIWTSGKIFGLQMKRPRLLPGPGKGEQQLEFKLSRPLAQFNRVKAIKEVFYVCPTFTNRNFRRRTLDHCIFWRPSGRTHGSSHELRYQYTTRGTRLLWQGKRKINSLRWGELIERVLSCSIGRSVDTSQDVETWLKKVRSTSVGAPLPRTHGQDTDIQMLIAIWVELI